MLYSENSKDLFIYFYASKVCFETIYMLEYHSVAEKTDFGHNKEEKGKKEMKKIFSLILAVLMVFSMAACGSKDSGSVEVKDALEILTKTWAAHADEEKFPVAGGDYNNSVMDGAGKFDLSDLEALDSMVGIPADAAAYVDDAANMMHMMNQNTFTAGAFHLSDAKNMDNFCDSVKEHIMARQWMCGFPDTLIIVSVGNEYVVTAFGNAEVIENFKTKLTETYSVSEVKYEESLAF